MATSGSKNYSITAIEIIGGALRKIGAFDHGDSIPPEEVADAMQALNLLTKEFAVRGLDIWVRKELILNLNVGQVVYTLGSGGDLSDRPVDILYAMRRNPTTNQDVPMDLIGEQEYQRLSLKQQPGIPVSLWYKPVLDSGQLYVWMPLSDTCPYTQLVMQARLYVDDFDSTVDEPEFPIEWGNALIFHLAHDLSPEYGVDRQKRADLYAIAERKLTDALDWSQENANVIFTIDQQRA